jgi:hypothetical protein
VSQAQRDALVDILDGLAGTTLERSGDISIIVNGTRYVVSGQTGRHAAATVVLRGRAEATESDAPYRSEMVEDVAALGLAKALEQAVGQEFTLKQIAADVWDGLSVVEQRNAGKRLRQLLKSKPLGKLEEWKTSDNEWHYRRR